MLKGLAGFFQENAVGLMLIGIAVGSGIALIWNMAKNGAARPMVIDPRDDDAVTHGDGPGRYIGLDMSTADDIVTWSNPR